MGGVAAGNRGKGRVKGVPNKLTVAAKQAFALAFEGIGGVAGLAAWADENRTEFYKLYARLIPVELSATVDHVIRAEEMSDDQLAAIAHRGSANLVAAKASESRAN